MAPGRLRLLREAHGLTQRDLARRLHLTSAFICMLEAGKKYPSEITIQKLLDLFHIDRAVLYIPVELPSPPDDDGFEVCGQCPYRYLRTSDNTPVRSTHTLHETHSSLVPSLIHAVATRTNLWLWGTCVIWSTA